MVKQKIPKIGNLSVTDGYQADGGAIRLFDSGGGVQRCVFSGNVAVEGGAVSLDVHSVLTLSDCLLACSKAGYPGS